jgi:hypothetical protein
MTRVPCVTALLLLVLVCPVQGQGTDFCAGYSEGWKAIRGELAIVPICPIAPITPIGSTPYREGIKAGMRAAERSGGGNSGSGAAEPSENAQARFCAGFAVGWKTVKGDLTIVPICPIAPITPIGSTPYREGLKAGVARARSGS